MRTTIDRAGRLVVPKALRDEIGLPAGEVDIEVDGASLRLRPATDTSLNERNGRLFIPAAGQHVDDEQVRDLRDADRQ